MIKKRITAYFIIFTLLFTIFPVGSIMPAFAFSDPVAENGRLVLFDFGSGSDSNLGTDTADNYRELTDAVSDSAANKTTSLMWTLPETANLNVEVRLNYQREYWPNGSDIYFRIYNGHSEANTFVLYFYTIETDYTPISRSFITLQPGWNTVSMSRSALDTAIPLENDIGVKFNVGGWRKTNPYVYTVGSKIYIDSAYVEFPNHGETISAPNPSIENGAGFVNSNLDGNNTYTLEFSEPLWKYSNKKDNVSYSIEDYVTVYEKSGSSYVETTQSYDVSVDSASLKLSFDEALHNAIYKVIVNSDAVLTASGKKLSENSEYYFSVGMESVIFAATTTSPEFSSGIIASEPGFKYTLNFNNTPSPVNISDMVSITEDGASYDNYIVSSGEKKIDITFTSSLKSKAEYKITLSDTLADTNGSFISGTKEFSFITADVIGDDGVLFDASKNEYLNVVTESSGTSFSFSHVTEGAFLGDKTVKITKNKENTNPYGKDFSNKIIPDITKFSYVNLLIYSPEASDEGLSVLLADMRESDNVFYKNALKFNWQGWKTISLPISEFANNNNTGTYIDKLKLDFNRNGSTWEMPSYVLIDRIWLSAQAPSELSLASTEYSDGESDIACNLGGDNAYRFTFNKNLADIDYSDAFVVEKHNGTSYEAYAAYSVIVSGKNLKIKFAPALEGNKTFRISLDLGKVLSSEYSLCSGSVQREFTVGGAPTYFNLTDSSVADGANVETLSQIKLTFNNKLNSSHYIPDYITLYKNNEFVGNAYLATTRDNVLNISFNNALTPGSYTIKISSAYTDSFGNNYIGKNSISFTVSDGKTGNVVLFTAEKEENFTKLNKKYEYSTDIVNLYPQTAKLSYKKGTTVYDGHIGKNIEFSAKGMNYLNLLMYSPKVTENVAHIVLYSDVSTNSYGGMKYELPLDFSGWKTISIPMTSFVTSDTYDAFLFNLSGWSHKEIYEDGYVLFDAIWLSESLPQDLQLTSSSFADGYEDCAVNGEILELEYNGDIIVTSSSEIKLEDESSSSDNYSLSINKNKMTFVFGNLGASKTYTLSIKNIMSQDFSILKDPVSISFTTAAGGVFINSISYSNKKTTVQIENTTSSDASLLLVSYAIGEGNVLADKKSKVITASPGITDDYVEFDTSAGINEVKAFVYDAEGRFLNKKYLSVTEGNCEIMYSLPVDNKAPSVSITTADISINLLTVKAKLSGVSSVGVAELSAPGSGLLSANTVKADENGNITYYCVIPDTAVTGVYTIKLTSDNLSAQESVKYVSKSDRDTLLGLANASSQANLSAFIKSIKSYIGLDGLSDTQLNDFALFAINNAPYNEYTDVTEFLLSLRTLLSDINSSSWAEISGLINANSEIFGGSGNSDINYFTKLSAKNQNAVSQIIVKNGLSVTTLSEFMSKLSFAIESFHAQSSKPQYGSSSSGGGSSSASFPAVSTPSADIPSEPPASPAQIFTDLENVKWAQESINKLLEMGVISKPNDGKFRPDDNITREEFTKLLVCAFMPEAEDNAYVFADSAHGAWYNVYLSKAYSSGIIKGYPDGRFGVGENITREDMVTLCARALQVRGINLPSDESVIFSDSSHISAYASSYIGAMMSLGVVNGMGDGSFAPKGNTTRAQAAKVIALLTEIY